MNTNTAGLALYCDKCDYSSSEMSYFMPHIRTHIWKSSVNVDNATTLQLRSLVNGQEALNETYWGKTIPM